MACSPSAIRSQRSSRFNGNLRSNNAAFFKSQPAQRFYTGLFTTPAGGSDRSQPPRARNCPKQDKFRRRARWLCQRPGPGRIIRAGGAINKLVVVDQALIEKMPSISTEIWPGSQPMRTAERPCLPLSPNTSTNRSDMPLATLGWSLKSGTALTMQSIFTERFDAISEPSAWRVAESSCSPTMRARFRPRRPRPRRRPCR